MSLQNQISIHALREEGDRLAAWQTCFQQDFYPRPPRGGRQAAAFVLALDKLFLSTPSARRATTSFHFCVTLVLISIHALREEGDAAGTDGAQDQKHFYPRPPRGGRHISLVYPQKTALFLSTPSARRATPHSGRPSSQPADFYPRPPRGGRLKASVTLYTLPNFYPRPPRGGRLY